MTEYGAFAVMLVMLFICGLTYCGDPDLHDIMIDRLTTEEKCEK